MKKHPELMKRAFSELLGYHFDDVRRGHGDNPIAGDGELLSALSALSIAAGD